MYSNDEPSIYGETSKDTYIKYILETYSQMLIRLCYTYVKNICDAEDITQDVLLTLMKREKPFEDNEHEKAWLIRTAINKCKNYLKSGWVTKTIAFDEKINNEIDDADNEVQSKQNEVMEAVLSLPEKYRNVIHLFYYNGYSINEISNILKKKPATIGTLLARGRTMLKKMMIGGFDDE